MGSPHEHPGVAPGIAVRVLNDSIFARESHLARGTMYVDWQGSVANGMEGFTMRSLGRLGC
jgi:hypothetical protein